MKYDSKRGSGRTLGLMLQALGKAIENPGLEVEFINHNPQNLSQHMVCKDKIESIAKKLNLDVKVVIRSNIKTNGYKVLIISNHIPPQIERTPTEEAYKKTYGEYPKTPYDTRFLWFSDGFKSRGESTVIDLWDC